MFSRVSVFMSKMLPHPLAACILFCVRCANGWNKIMYRVTPKVAQVRITNRCKRSKWNLVDFTMFLRRIKTIAFMQLLNIACKLAQSYYTEKWQLSMVSDEVILCCNSIKYEAIFVIFDSCFWLGLSEVICAKHVVLLKYFPPGHHIITLPG